MSDVMLFGVLRMPFDMAMADEMSRWQYWQRGQQAADELTRLRAENAELRAEREAMAKQGPVVWRTVDCGDEGTCCYMYNELGQGEPLYAAPKP